MLIANVAFYSVVADAVLVERAEPGCGTIELSDHTIELNILFPLFEMAPNLIVVGAHRLTGRVEATTVNSGGMMLTGSCTYRNTKVRMKAAQGLCLMNPGRRLTVLPMVTEPERPSFTSRIESSSIEIAQIGPNPRVDILNIYEFLFTWADRRG